MSCVNRTTVAISQPWSPRWTFIHSPRASLFSDALTPRPTAQNGTISYIYDKVGNRKEIVSSVGNIPAGLWSYDANDRITTGGEGCDNNGNTIASGGIAATYDFENRAGGAGFT